jgi:hypothetical protein
LSYELPRDNLSFSDHIIPRVLSEDIPRIIQDIAMIHVQSCSVSQGFTLAGLHTNNQNYIQSNAGALDEQALCMSGAGLCITVLANLH